MIKRKPSLSYLTPLVRPSAQRLIAEHGTKAGDFAKERLQAAIEANDATETEIWRAIAAAIPQIFTTQRF